MHEIAGNNRTGQHVLFFSNAQVRLLQFGVDGFEFRDLLHDLIVQPRVFNRNRRLRRQRGERVFFVLTVSVFNLIVQQRHHA